jgi:hypothetical protein
VADAEGGEAREVDGGGERREVARDGLDAAHARASSSRPSRATSGSTSARAAEPREPVRPRAARRLLDADQHRELRASQLIRERPVPARERLRDALPERELPSAVFNTTLAAARRSCRPKSASRRSTAANTGRSSANVSNITG